MGLDETRASTIMRAQVDQSGEVCMVDQERWAEIRRLFQEERVSISEIGRRLDLDRKTVFVRDRAPQVGYSARILYQELRVSRATPAVTRR